MTCLDPWLANAKSSHVLLPTRSAIDGHRELRPILTDTTRGRHLMLMPKTLISQDTLARSVPVELFKLATHRW